jgi:hypothetical protein
VVKPFLYPELSDPKQFINDPLQSNGSDRNLQRVHHSSECQDLDRLPHSSDHVDDLKDG